MPNKAIREHILDLTGVTTVPTICRHWHKHKNVVYYNINAGNLVAVKDGGVWLVSVTSVEHLWGVPILPKDYFIENLCERQLTLPMFEDMMDTA